jgi:hypothetical protein
MQDRNGWSRSALGAFLLRDLCVASANSAAKLDLIAKAAETKAFVAR